VVETTIVVTKEGKREIYAEILPQIRSLLEGESDWIANLSNVSSALKYAFPERISWVGFYLLRGNDLVLGPFQGKPACVRIGMGRGVCGTAAKELRTLIVPDVSTFPGHIACDPDSKSEIVVPILKNNVLIGVLDLDSSSLNSFDETDSMYLKQVVSILLNASIIS
jgi:GAF domain-containing protein